MTEPYAAVAIARREREQSFRPAPPPAREWWRGMLALGIWAIARLDGLDEGPEWPCPRLAAPHEAEKNRSGRRPSSDIRQLPSPLRIAKGTKAKLLDARDSSRIALGQAEIAVSRHRHSAHTGWLHPNP